MYRRELSTRPAIVIGTPNAIDTFADRKYYYRSLRELSPNVSRAIETIDVIAASTETPGNSRAIDALD